MNADIVPARQALMEAMLLLGGSGIPHSAAVRSLAVAAATGLVATSTADDVVHLWTIDSGPGRRPRPLSSTKLAASPLAFSPDGRWLVAGEGDSTALCRVQEGPRLRCGDLVPKGVYVHQFAFHPTGRWLVAVGNDNDVWSWDLSLDRPAEEPRQIGRALYTVRYVHFSANGEWLVGQGLTVEDVWVWPVGAGEIGPMRTISPHRSRVDAVAVDPHGRRLAIGYEDGAVIVASLGLSGGSQRLAAPAGDHSIDELTFSGDGTWLAGRMLPVRDRDRRGSTALLWRELPSGRFASPELLLHDDQTRTVAFDPRSQWLYVESTRGPVSLWSLAGTRQQRSALRLTAHAETVVAFGFDAEGTRLITADSGGDAYLWDLSCTDVTAGATPLSGHEAGIRSVSMLPGSTAAMTRSDDGTVRVWDLLQPSAGDPNVLLRSCRFEIAASALRADRAAVAAGTSTGEVFLWDLTVLEPSRHTRRLGRISASEDPVEGLAFDASGHRLAAWTDGGRLVVWTALHTSRPKRFDLNGHEARMAILSVSFCGSERVASADFSGNAWLWTLRNGTPERTRIPLSTRERRITDVLASPDGRWLAGHGRDELWLWDLSVQNVNALSLSTPDDSVITSVGFGPSGRFIWAADGTGVARIWSVPRVVTAHDRVLEGQDTGPWPLRFSAGGRFMLARGEADDRPHLWSTDRHPSSWTARPLRGTDASAAGAFSHDEQLIAGASGSVVTLWTTQEPGEIRSVLRADDLIDQIRFSRSGDLIFSAVSEVYLSPIVDYRAVPALRLRAHQGRIWFVEPAAEDRWLVTQSYDTLRLWPLVTRELLESVRSRTGRDYRPEERAAYLPAEPRSPGWRARVRALLLNLNARLLDSPFAQPRPITD